MLALTAPPCVMCHHGFPVGLTYFNKCLLSWIYEYWAFGLEKVYFPYDEQVVFDRDEAVSATPKFFLMHLYLFLCVRETICLYNINILCPFLQLMYYSCSNSRIFHLKYLQNNLGFSQNLISGICFCLMSFTISKKTKLCDISKLDKKGTS